MKDSERYYELYKGMKVATKFSFISVFNNDYPEGSEALILKVDVSNDIQSIDISYTIDKYRIRVRPEEVRPIHKQSKHI